MSFTAALDQSLLAALINNTSYAAGATLYLGASTSTPTTSGSNFTEPVGNGYARVSFTANTASFSAPTNASPSVSSNVIALAFPQATASWGTITYFGIFTAASGGVPIAYGALLSSQLVSTGNILTFAIGQLTVSQA